MLMNMKELLKVALENKFAVPAFNIGSHELLMVTMAKAIELNSPIILDIHPAEVGYFGDSLIKTVIEEAKNAPIPVVVHLDHGETMFDIMRAVNNGYTSVMIDASLCDFEENIKRTKNVIELVHPLNISVEAELGTIGNTGDSIEGGASEIILADPVQAKEFVQRTNVDTLAVAIGTSHGLYPKDKVPVLDIELLKVLNETLKIPMVLHGGSGNSDAEVSESVKYGVAKVNISSDIKSVFFKEVKQYLDEHPNSYEPNEIYPFAFIKTKEIIEHKYQVLNSVGAAKFYK